MNTTANQQLMVKAVIEIAIKLTVLGIILFVSYLIVKPFLGVILWAVIIAVAAFPLIERLGKYFGHSRLKVIIFLLLIGISSLIVPSYLLSEKIVESTESLSSVVEQGKIVIPPPSEKVKQWPVIGDKVFQWWNAASQNLTQTLKPFDGQIKKAAKILLSLTGNTLSSIFLSIISMFIAVFIILDAEKYAGLFRKVSTRLIDKKGEELVTLSVLTIRSVATGIIGVALIQATFAMLGLVLMDVPFSLLVAIGIMGLSIVQLPTILLVGPVILYVFSYADTTQAVIFSIYMLLVSMSDSILKPLLMGRGVDIPMLILITGAIGGMLLMGVIGLFVGAVIFSLLYTLFWQWLKDTSDNK